MSRVVRLTISLSDLCSLTKGECVSQLDYVKIIIPKSCDIFSLANLQLVHLL